jgi:hypothetical protein
MFVEGRWASTYRRCKGRGVRLEPLHPAATPCRTPLQPPPFPNGSISRLNQRHVALLIPACPLRENHPGTRIYRKAPISLATITLNCMCSPIVDQSCGLNLSSAAYKAIRSTKTDQSLVYMPCDRSSGAFIRFLNIFDLDEINSQTFHLQSLRPPEIGRRTVALRSRAERQQKQGIPICIGLLLSAKVSHSRGRLGLPFRPPAYSPITTR